MAIIKKYSAKVIAVHSIIDDVYTLEIESINKPFKFMPGQFLHLALDEYDPSGQWPDSRCFSIQSSPEKTRIKITYSVKGEFTTRMKNVLKPDSEIFIKLPYGDLFSQLHNKRDTIFIAGGTGITPFLSLFTHSSFSEYIEPILHAGFRNPRMNLYKSDLNIAHKINSSFIINTVYEDKNGLLNIKEILKSSKASSCFFISGPPEMIKSFRNNLISSGIPQNQILTDDWG